MKVLFLIPYPLGKAGSQRFRFEQYFDKLQQSNIEYHIQSFLSENTWNVIYSKGNVVKKVYGIFKGFVRRFFILFTLNKYEFVFIHREAAPIGPPIIEWLIAKFWNRKIIYDFDDAIWLPNYSESNKAFSFLKRHSNVASICKWSHRISCGNKYLSNYAAKYNGNIILNPTTIDTDRHHNNEKKYNLENQPLTIGWTGSHSTIRYLYELLPVLLELEKVYKFTFLVISDKNPKLDLSSFQFIQWKKETEVEDLLNLDIGVMPLSNDPWANGKCGFKALQYMALGIPAIVSPVGVNSDIVDDGINGYICNTPSQWKEKLELLVTNKKALLSLSTETRKKIIKKYSVNSNIINYLSLFAQ